MTQIGPEGKDKPDSRLVRIATMHRAKGLEFDEVVLLMPKSYRDFKNETDQMRRLQYVAITRAKRLASVLCY